MSLAPWFPPPWTEARGLAYLRELYAEDRISLPDLERRIETVLTGGSPYEKTDGPPRDPSNRSTR